MYNGISYAITSEGTLSVPYINLDEWDNTVIIPQSVDGITVKKLCYGFLRNYTNVRAVAIPNTVEEIGSFAFEETMITEIVIPKSVKIMGTGIFQKCIKLFKITFEQDTQVDRIPSRFANNCFTLKSINIPTKIKKIQGYAFNGCTALEYVDFEAFDNLKYIENNAFCYSGLENITFNKSLLDIKDKVFNNCSSLKKVVFPKDAKVRKIGAYAFSECLMLSDVEIHSTSIRFEEGCFSNNESLKHIDLSGCEAFLLSDSMFKNSSLKTVEFPKDLRFVGKEAFANCCLEKILRIPASIKEIGPSAFINNKISLLLLEDRDSFITLLSNSFTGNRLTELIVHPKMKLDGKNIFSNNELLKRVAFPNNMSNIPEGIFKNCFQLSTLFMPKSLKKIENEAFCGCVSLKELKFPNSLKSIGEQAFSHAGLTSLDLQNTDVIEIKKETFFCTDINTKSLKLNYFTTQISANAFSMDIFATFDFNENCPFACIEF